MCINPDEYPELTLLTPSEQKKLFIYAGLLTTIIHYAVDGETDFAEAPEQFQKFGLHGSIDYLIHLKNHLGEFIESIIERTEQEESNKVLDEFNKIVDGMSFDE